MDELKNVPRKALQFGSEFIFDEEKSKFEGVAYSGEMIKDHFFWGNLVFDIDSISSKDTIPVLQEHDRKLRAGKGKLKKEDSMLKIDGSIMNTSAGREIKELSNDGFPWEMSVHIEPSRVDTYHSGTKVNVNNRTFEGPVTVFRDSVVREVSFVTLGADPNTSGHAFSQEQDKIIPIKRFIKEEGDSKMHTITIKDDKVIFNDQEVATIKKIDDKFTFDCGCGGGKKKEQTKEEEEIVLKKTEFDDLLAKLKSYEDKEIATLMEAQKSVIKEQFNLKGVELTNEQLESYLKFSKEQLDLVLSSMPAKQESLKEKELKKIPTPQDIDKNKFSNEVDLIRAKAGELLKSGVAKTMAEAIIKVQV
jgi:hypothetical protein